MSENTIPNVPNFTITRTFDARIEKVWLAWSEEENFVQWWGPKGFEITIAKMDFEPDGLLLYSMKNEKLEMWGRFVYQEIIAPKKIVFINSFSDPQGGVTRAPFFDGKWPLEVYNIVTFEEIEGKTTITLTGYPINPTPEEMAAFESNKASMNHGFSGTWSQLDEYLAQENNGFTSITAKFEPSAEADVEA